MSCFYLWSIISGLAGGDITEFKRIYQSDVKVEYFHFLNQYKVTDEKEILLNGITKLCIRASELNYKTIEMFLLAEKEKLNQI